MPFALLIIGVTTVLFAALSVKGSLINGAPVLGKSEYSLNDTVAELIVLLPQPLQIHVLI